MAFFTSAIATLQTLVIALGAGLGVWGLINLLEGSTASAMAEPIPPLAPVTRTCFLSLMDTPKHFNYFHANYRKKEPRTQLPQRPIYP